MLSLHPWKSIDAIGRTFGGAVGSDQLSPACNDTRFSSSSSKEAKRRSRKQGWRRARRPFQGEIIPCWGLWTIILYKHRTGPSLPCGEERCPKETEIGGEKGSLETRQAVTTLVDRLSRRLKKPVPGPSLSCTEAGLNAIPSTSSRLACRLMM